VEKEGGTVAFVAVLVDRQEGGRDKIEAMAIRLSRCSRRKTCSETMPNHINERVCGCVNWCSKDCMRKILTEPFANAIRCTGQPARAAFLHAENIFREMAEALESGAIEVSRFEELVRGISEKVSLVLQKLGSGNSVTSGELEDLVRTHVVNRNLFRS